MESDDFFATIDQEVFVANADKINVYVRYADTSQGSTTPNGATTFKVEVASTISCVTSSSYGFHHWAVFSTNNFNINGQNPEIIYASDNNEYVNGAGQNELLEDVVTFGDRYSETTSVVIHQNRNDLVLVPIVAVRPSVDRTSPANNATNVVRNTAIRYIFTKKMDLSSFTKENVKITSGFAVLTDLDTASTDITDLYIWGNPATDETYSPMISSNGKLITFRLRPGIALDSNQQITVMLSGGIKDADGYEEASQQKLYFITGTSIDALAPILNQVTGGINGRFKDFASVEKANHDTIKTRPLEDSFFDEYLPQRVKDYVNIYVSAADIGGEGPNVVVSDTDEGAVIYYGTRARLLYNSDGDAVDTDAAENNLESKQQSYVGNENYVNGAVESTGGFGCAFTYDLSALPDGLIEIDIWAVDTAGNSGLSEPYYESYDNGYRALLVVKDSRSPVVDVGSVKSESSVAIYGWYNEETLGETNIVRTSDITDSGNIRLRSPDSGIRWAFTVGENASSWSPAGSDGAWRLVTDGAYPLSGLVAQSEGSVGILMSLMDDMGNISATAAIGNAVMFDKTPPYIGALSWVDSSGNPARFVTKDENLAQYLQIPFTESLSGVREIVINVGTNSGIVNGVTKFYAALAGEEIPYTINIRNGETCVALTPPSGEQGYKTGSIFVKGIKLGTSVGEGNYIINAAVYDAAFNKSNYASKNISYDITVPEISSVVVNDVASGGWLKNNAFTVSGATHTPNKASVTVTATERTSGIETIVLSGAKLTAETNVIVGGTAIPCSVDVASGTITLAYSENPVLKSDSNVVFTIRGIEFNEHLDDGNANIVEVKVYDFARNESTPKQSSNVYVDTKTPEKPVIKILDKASEIPGGNTYWTWTDTNEKYTNSDVVDIKVTIGDNVTGASGVTTLTFTNINLSGATVDFGGSINGSKVTFTSAITATETITITNAKLPSKNQAVAVSVTATDFVGWESETSESTIIHDDIKPAFGDGQKPTWLAISSSDLNGITDRPNQSTAVSPQKLRIPYEESGSGIKVVKIDGALTSTVTAVYNGATKLAASNYTLNDNYIVFKTPLVSASSYIDIEGLNLANPVAGDHTYTVTVSLYDAAENKDASTSGNTANISVDTTAPIFEKIVLPAVQRVQNYDVTDWQYFVDKDVCLSNSTTVELYIKEANSGIRTIDFTGSGVKPSASSTITMVVGGTSTAVTDFTLSSGVITFGDGLLSTVRDGSGNAFKLEISNCQFAGVSNAISVLIKDFAGLSSGSGTPLNKATFTEDDSKYAQIIKNSSQAGKPTISLADRGTSDYPGLELAAVDGYTNFKIVNAVVTIPAASSSVNSTREISIVSGANFITSGGNETTIKVQGAASALSRGTHYSITATKITFVKTFATATVLEISNIELADNSTDGEKTIYAVSVAPTKIESLQASTSIILDTVAPDLSENGPVAVSGTDISVEYPRYTNSSTPIYGLTASSVSVSPTTNGDGKTIRYFYTKNANRTLGITVTDENPIASGKGIRIVNNLTSANSKAENVLSQTTPLRDFTATTDIKLDTIASSAAPYSYIATDKAGNVSKAYSFYIVQDDTEPSLTVTSGGVSLATRMVFKEPTGAHTHRNPAVGSDVTYVIKRILSRAADDKYRITVKLNGIESSDKLLEDANATADNTKYSELTPTATQSGLAAWAVTSNGAEPASSAWKTTSASDIEFEVNDYIVENKKITLHLKDNCGNTNKIDIQESNGKTVLWSVDDAPPSVTTFAAASALSSGSGLTGSYTSAVGSKFGRTYVDGNKTYFNDKAFLGITYGAEKCLFPTKTENSDDTIPAGTNYTVKARLYYTNGASATMTNNDISTISGADSSSATYVSPWYYFADTTSAARTFYVPYPNRGEGASGLLYLLLEDTVGNQSLTQVYNDVSSTKVFCYNNEPPVVKLNGGSTPTTYTDVSSTFTDFGTARKYTHLNQSTETDLKTLVSVDNSKTISVSGTTTTVYSGVLGVPEFNIALIDSASKLVAYKYGTTDSVSAKTGYTGSATISKAVPADLLYEAGSVGATENSLYLYVYDNVGNISVTKLGNTKYLKDGTVPATATAWASEGHTNPENSYIKQGAGGKLTIMIAASSDAYTAASAAHSDYTVYIPVSWFSDLGADVLGLGFAEDDASAIPTATVNNASTNNVKCFAVKIPYSIYNAGGTNNYYVYDKVYNYKPYTLTTDADADAPTVGAKFSVASGRLHSTDLYKSDLTTPAANSLIAASGYVGTNSVAYTEESKTPQTVPDAKTLWSSVESVTLELTTNDDNGISLVAIRKSTDNGTTYTDESRQTNDDSSYKNWNFNGGTTSGDTKASPKITLTATTTKTLYEISATDFAGNTMKHYVYLQLDNTKPTISGTAKPNNGAKTKTSGTTTTLYYKSLDLSATITDGGVGLGAYQLGTGNFASTDGSFSQTYSGAAEDTAETITLKAHDILGNESENTEWTVFGTANTATEFIYDNTAPAISTVVGKRDGTAAAAGSMFTVANAGSTWTFTLTSAKDCEIEISPTWSDTNGVYKYFVKSTSGAPSVADFESEGKDVGDSLTFAASPNSGAGIDITLSATETFMRYLYAIDYAGNISASATIIVKYNDIAPKFTSATFKNISTGTPNIYSPTIGYMTLTYTVQSGGALTGYAFYSDASGETPIGSAQTVASATSPLNIFLPEYANETETFSIYIRLLCDGGESALTKLEGTWKMDKTAPASAPTVSGIQNSSGTSLSGNGYYFDSATGKLYYKAITESYLNFTMPSGATKIVTSNTYPGTFTVVDAKTVPVAIASLISAGSTTFYAADDAYNPSTASTTVSYVLDSTKPEILTPALTGATGVYLDASEKKLYYSSTSTGTLAFTVEDPAGGSGPLVENGFINRATAPTSIAATDLETSINLASTTLTGNQKFYTADKVGNISDAYTLNFVKDVAGPELSDIDVKGDVANGYSWDSTNKKFYFNSNASSSKKIGKITITLTATDTASSVVSVKLGTDSFTAGASDSYSYEIDSMPASERNVTITATDKVGNATTYTIALVPDATAPEISLSKFKNGSTEIAATATTVYIDGGATAWPTVTGKTIFFNSSEITNPKVEFTADDGSEVTTDNDIAPSGSTTVTATATDSVGNTATFEVTFTADGTGPGAPVVSSITGTVGEPPAAIADYYPTAFTDWTGGALCYFKGSSGTIKFTTPTDDGSGFDGIYEYNASTNAIGSKITTGIAISEEKTITVVALDNVGNKSTVLTFKVKPDNAAPTATPTLSGSWYALADSTGATKMSVYVSGAELAVSGSDDSGIASYVLQYGASSSTPATADWTTFASPIALPTITTAEDSYFWLWLKDNVGNVNASATQIKYSDSPIGMYVAPTGLSYTYDGTANAQKITISGYPISAGLKSIILEADEFDTSTTTTCTGISVAESSASGKITLTAVDASSNAITIMQTSNIEIALSLASITNLKVSVVDANNTTTELAAPGGASMFSMARRAASSMASGASRIGSGIVSGAKNIGSSVTRSVKSFFGVGSKTSVVEKNTNAKESGTVGAVRSLGVISNPSAPKNVASVQDTAEIATTQISTTSIVETPVVETQNILDNSEIVEAKEIASVTVPSIKKESVVRTLTYSTEEEVSPQASIAENIASATETVSEPSVENGKSSPIMAIIISCILASVLAFSAIFLLKKNKDVL